MRDGALIPVIEIPGGNGLAQAGHHHICLCQHLDIAFLPISDYSV